MNEEDFLKHISDKDNVQKLCDHHSVLLHVSLDDVLKTLDEHHPETAEAMRYMQKENISSNSIAYIHLNIKE